METFTPRGENGSAATAFTTEVSAGVATTLENYRFDNFIRTADATGTSAGVAVQSYIFSVRNGQLSAIYTEITYDRGIARSLFRVCAAPCSGLTLTPTASGFGVSVGLAGVTFVYSAVGTTAANPSTTPVVMTGSLVGEMPAGYAFVRQLPRATQGTLSLAGAPAPITFGDVGYANVTLPDPTLFPTVALKTDRGNLEVIASTDGTTTSYGARFTTQPEGERLFAPVTASALVPTADGYAVNLNAVTLTGSGPTLRSLVVTAAVTVGKPGGNVAITGDTSFSPLSSVVEGRSQSLMYDFRRFAGGAQSVITVRMKAGEVTSFSAQSATSKLYTCDNVGGMFMAKCDGSIGVSADGRTLTFNGFKAGLVNTPAATVSFTGSLTATGL